MAHSAAVAPLCGIAYGCSCADNQSDNLTSFNHRTQTKENAPPCGEAFSFGSPHRETARTVPALISQLIKFFQENVPDKYWKPSVEFEPIYIPPSVAKKFGNNSEFANKFLNIP